LEANLPRKNPPAKSSDQLIDRPWRLFERPDRHNQPLYVICPIFNPVRWRTRWALYEDFKDMVQNSGPQAILVTIEVAFGDRDFVVTTPDNPFNIQLRSSTTLWLKENLINIAVSRLPADWSRVAWVDGDVLFTRSDWADQASHLLCHYKFLQLWSQYQDLNSDGEMIGTARSFMDQYVSGDHEKPEHKCPPCPPPEYPTYPYYPARPGYPGAPGLAWACTREAWEAVGGLIDVAILGASDFYMAWALVGGVEKAIRPGYHPNFKHALMTWQDRAERYIRRNVGVMKGLALHYPHGPKAARKYATRDQILVDCQYDPYTDLQKDSQGLYSLVDHGTLRDIKLRDGIRSYLMSRREDDPVR
jgi:hypothetical protein